MAGVENVKFGLRQVEWPGDDGVEFHLPRGEMLRALRASGFEVLDLLELQAPEAGDPGRFDWLTLEWARRWPSEELWVARRVREPGAPPGPGRSPEPGLRSV